MIKRTTTIKQTALEYKPIFIVFTNSYDIKNISENKNVTAVIVETNIYKNINFILK